MIEFLKKFFSLPTNLEEQKASDSREYKIVSVCFAFLLIYMILVMVGKWSAKDYTQKMGLFYITLLNTLSFAIFSIATYQLSVKAKLQVTYDGVKKVKLVSYFLFIIVIGIPYMFMTAYLFFNHDYSGGSLLVFIFSSAVLTNYFYDWRRFLLLKAKNE